MGLITLIALIFFFLFGGGWRLGGPPTGRGEVFFGAGA
jgi:hypothetical protein